MHKDIEYLKKYVDKDKYAEALKRLENGEPVQYIVGNVDFYGYIFKVNKNVLIPRFETEELVYKTSEYIKKHLTNNPSIIDLGTGSGCIAITLKHIFPLAKIKAIDISKEALNIAKENSNINKTEIVFQEGNMLDSINEKYDVIVSNPPYISYDEKIMDIVKNNEPSLALYASNNGLDFYQKILSKASKNLNYKSIIAFEIGQAQGLEVSNLAKTYFPNSFVSIERDMQGKDRFVFVFNNIKI